MISHGSTIGAMGTTAALMKLSLLEGKYVCMNACMHECMYAFAWLNGCMYTYMNVDDSLSFRHVTQ